MFNGKSFNEKFVFARKHYDFAHAINCTHKLTCVCACVCACDCTHLREQYDTGEAVFSVHKTEMPTEYREKGIRYLKN